MIKCKIDVYTHFFIVSKVHPTLFDAIRETFRDLTQVQKAKVYGRFKQIKKKIYATKNYNNTELRYHINYLPRFKDLLMCLNINDSEVEYTYFVAEKGDEVNIKLVPDFVPYDYQEQHAQYIVDDGVSKLITLATGKGKGLVSMRACELINERILVVVLARYKQKWEDELYEKYGKDFKLLSINKLSELYAVLDKTKDNPLTDVDAILMSKDIMMGYIRDWEEHGGSEIDGMIPPEEIYKRLGIGVKIIDEAHQHFHAIFKMDLYTHVNKVIYLTATLDTMDRFQSFLYTLMWPMAMRIPNIKYEPYDNTFALFYNHAHPERIRCMGSQGYSHVKYEQSIWKHIPSRVQYLDMIGDVVEYYFLPEYIKGRRMIIFCSLVETCEYVAYYLSKRFKQQAWKISKFIAGDDKSIVDTNDITISTLGKAGTALDIPGLIVTFNTVALSEPKANKQVKGRNRNLKHKPGFENITPKFIYLVGSDIPKHYEYHKAKVKLFEGYTLNHIERPIGYTIGIPIKEYLRYGGKEDRTEAWNVNVR